MRRFSPFAPALLCVFAVVVFTGCGGDDETGSTAAAEPDPATTVSVEQFRTGFSEQTGIELTASDFAGEAVLLGFDDDGDAMEFSEAETAFQDEYASAQIFVVESGGDPDQIFDVVTGKGRDEASLESGGDTLRLITTIADEPDADGVIWTEQCLRYEKRKSRDSCSWTGSKRYGRNVIVSWTATSDTLDEASSRLDEAVSAVVAGA